jgi:magnesium and cobalt transporter
MQDGPSHNQHSNWFERLSKFLLPEPKNQIELAELLQAASQRQVIDIESLHMIEGVLKVSRMQVRDIMVPRSQMIVVSLAQTLAEIIPIINESGHSRFPVISDNRDEVIGILLAKDLLNYAFKTDTQQGFNIKEILRPAVFVPEAKRLNTLLKEFRLNRNHMAVVVDEYGGIGGLITIEDVLEEIVGDIEDEHDIQEEKPINQVADNQYLVDALTPIEEFNEFFNSTFSDDEFDTIGGLVMQNFGRLPTDGESVIIDGFSFKVLEADNRRVHKLEVSVQKDVS